MATKKKVIKKPTPKIKLLPNDHIGIPSLSATGCIFTTPMEKLSDTKTWEERYWDLNKEMHLLQDEVKFLKMVVTKLCEEQPNYNY